MRSTLFAVLFLFALLSYIFLSSGTAIKKAPPPSKTSLEVRRLVLLANYLSGDYKEAVNSSGLVINKDEYSEMLEFASKMKEIYGGMKAKDSKVYDELNQLEVLIKAKASPDSVKEKAAYLAKTFKEVYSLVSVLPSYPDLKKGKILYQGMCASCHGVLGDAKTPFAKTLNPPPRDLIEKEFSEELSPSRTHNTLKLGIEGTSMISYESILSEEDKWHVSFYVASLPFRVSLASKKSVKSKLSSYVKELSWTNLADMNLSDLRGWVLENSSSKDEAKASSDLEALRLISFDPQVLSLENESSEGETPKTLHTSLDYTREKLKEILVKLENKDFKPLSGLLLDAYLEGFENFERKLKIMDPEKLLKLERDFMALRSSANRGAFGENFRAGVVALDGELKSLELLFSSAKKSSGFSSFSEVLSSVMIILREGLEAFLIVMALLALVQNLGLRSAKIWIHSAWILATILGFVTYFLMEKVFELSGANRELLEAFLTGFAVLMLFYTGFWLLSQSSSRKWNHFVKGESKNTLTRGNLWSFFGLAFVAVYREAAETVLFYSALLSTASSKYLVVLGFLIGVFLLVSLCLGLLYYNIKIPLDKFFKLTSSLMFVLSFVLMGKAIYELIESGYLQQTPLNYFPRIEALGLYPFGETVLAQAILLVLTVALLLWFRSSGKKKGDFYKEKSKSLGG